MTINFHDFSCSDLCTIWPVTPYETFTWRPAPVHEKDTKHRCFPLRMLVPGSLETSSYPQVGGASKSSWTFQSQPIHLKGGREWAHASQMPSLLLLQELLICQSLLILTQFAAGGVFSQNPCDKHRWDAAAMKTYENEFETKHVKAISVEHMAICGPRVIRECLPISPTDFHVSYAFA